jgi:hypothetical protein
MILRSTPPVKSTRVCVMASARTLPVCPRSVRTSCTPSVRRATPRTVRARVSCLSRPTIPLLDDPVVATGKEKATVGGDGQSQNAVLGPAGGRAYQLRPRDVSEGVGALERSFVPRR